MVQALHVKFWAIVVFSLFRRYEEDQKMIYEAEIHEVSPICFSQSAMYSRNILSYPNHVMLLHKNC